MPLSQPYAWPPCPDHGLGNHQEKPHSGGAQPSQLYSRSPHPVWPQTGQQGATWGGGVTETPMAHHVKERRHVPHSIPVTLRLEKGILAPTDLRRVRAAEG